MELNIQQLAAALQIVNVAAFNTGYQDGLEQGFELSMGMTYDNDIDQWAYDVGSHIGACAAVHPDAKPKLAPKSMKAVFAGTIAGGFSIVGVVNAKAANALVVDSLARGELAEAIEICDPGLKDGSYALDESGNHFAVIGTGRGNSICVYGPFSEYDIAEQFAERNRDDQEWELFQSTQTPEAPQQVDEAARHRQDLLTTLFAESNQGTMLFVNIQDIVGQYELPEQIPEWAWIEKHHSLAHAQNGKYGVWEFAVNVELERKDAPERLQPLLAQALANNVSYVVFHQGT